MSEKPFSTLIITRHGVNYEIKIDTEDLHILGGRKPRWNRGYAAIQIKGKEFFVHRLITKAMPGQYVDHINLDIRDNRKCNLRLVTHAQNNQHKRVRKNTRTGIRGVYHCANSNKYRASVGYRGKQIHVGCFETKQEAEIAVIAKRRELGFLDANSNNINS